MYFEVVQISTDKVRLGASEKFFVNMERDVIPKVNRNLEYD